MHVRALAIREHDEKGTAHGRFQYRAQRDDGRASARAGAGRGRRRRRVRYTRGSDPPRVRPPLRLHESAAHPRPPRAGRRTRGGGVRAGNRQGRGLHGDLRTRCDEPGNADLRRLHGLGADRGDHWAGRARIHRHGRVPGGRHLRHHAADHQAQLSGAVRSRGAAGRRRGIPSGVNRTARPGSDRSAQGRAARNERRSAGHRGSTCRAIDR